jgi:ATP-dependent DNA helicase RecG
MESEGNSREYKSVLKIRNGINGLKDLAETCVAFANTQGGDIFIGIENVSRVPPSGQIITEEEVNDAITRLRTLCSNVLITPSTILKDGDGGDYFIITISPSVKSIASTADGKFFVRVGNLEYISKPLSFSSLQPFPKVSGTYKGQNKTNHFSSYIFGKTTKKF